MLFAPVSLGSESHPYAASFHSSLGETKQQQSYLSDVFSVTQTSIHWDTCQTHLWSH